ncbi:MAG: membrane integrity-associated transporter subunit PqiC [Alcaligenaceae bacterium]|nr:membrane integrity-associated transporter subunit PqiC [Alcaligenaceae bacterium]
MKFLFLGAAALLAGCATQAPQYYSLQAPALASSAQNGPVVADYAIRVQPVLIPEQLARPQIVVATAQSPEVIPLNAALWAGPLEAQIRGTLAAVLAHNLNVMDISSPKFSGDTPVWQIYFDVQRFDSIYGEAIRQDVVWRMVPQGMPSGVSGRVCSAQLTMPVGEGMSALVAGHRQALEHLGGLVGQTLPWPSQASAPAFSALPEGLKFRGCVG